MKELLVVLLLMATLSSLFSYGVAQFNRTYIDPSRDNRQIPTVIFYPIATSDRIPSESASAVESCYGVAPSFPVIVFGHGWIMPYTTYLDLANHFVSLGWIVAFPTTEGGLFPSHTNFALDLAFVVQAVLSENNDPASELYGQVDSFTVHMGHSMGGGASVLAAVDTTASVLVTLAAANTNPSAINAATGVVIPSLTLAGGSDMITPPAQHQIPIYHNLASSFKSYVSFNGVSHLSIYSNSLVFSIINSWLTYARSGDSQDLDVFFGLLDKYQAIGELNFDHFGYPVPVQDYNAPPLVAHLAVSPNPFYSQAVITYKAGKETDLTIEVYNLKGQRVRLIHKGYSPTEGSVYYWNGLDDMHRPLPAGIYLVRAQSGNSVRSVKTVKLE